MGKLELYHTLTNHVGRVWNVAWHPNPNGDALFSCGEDKTIRIWEKVDSKWVNKIVLESHKCTMHTVSRCGKYLMTGFVDRTTNILEEHENEVKSVTWSKSGKLLVTFIRDKSVWVWDVAEKDEYECTVVLNSHTQDVKKVIWHPERDLLASASYDNTVKIFKEDPANNDWVCVTTLDLHESTAWSLAFNKTGKRLATGSDDATVKIWQEYPPDNPEGVPMTEGDSVWKCVCTLSGFHRRTIYDISWCHATGLIATACGDDIIRIFKEDADSDPNAPSFSFVSSVERPHSLDVNAVSWNPKIPGLLASCSDDGNIKLWNYTD